jgi:hypothetical protein
VYEWEASGLVRVCPSLLRNIRAVSEQLELGSTVGAHAERTVALSRRLRLYSGARVGGCRYDASVTQPQSTPIPPPDATIMKRLGFARLMYEQAVVQSFAPAPLNVSSVLAFHDVIEFLFLVAVAHVGAGQGIDPKLPFSQTVRKLVAADGAGVSSMDAVRRIAHDRDGFKHNGSIPGAEQIEQARRDATVFLEANCLRFFGLPFAEVSMLHLVHHLPVRAHLQAGRAAADAGDIAMAMSEAALAFDTLISDWGGGKHLPGSAMRQAPFDLHAGPPTPRPRIAASSLPSDAPTRRAIEGVASTVAREFETVNQEL